MVNTRALNRQMLSAWPQEEQKPEISHSPPKRKRNDDEPDPHGTPSSHIVTSLASNPSAGQSNDIRRAGSAEILTDVTAMSNALNIADEVSVKVEEDGASPEKRPRIDKSHAGCNGNRTSNGEDIEMTHGDNSNEINGDNAEEVYESSAISDDGLADDDEVATSCYDSSEEPFPAQPVFDVDLTQLKAQLLQIPQSFLALMADHKSNNQHVASYCDTATSLLTIPAPKPPRIALLGNAGVGKSSLLNSLTDINDLAKAISSGQSCTSVPSEYTSPLNGQSLKYGAKVHYLSTNKISALLGEMFQHYFDYWYEDTSQMDDNMRALSQARAQNALDSIRVLFCDQKGFEDQTSVSKTLEQAWNEASNSVGRRQTATMSHLLKIIKHKLVQKNREEDSYTEFVEVDTHDQFTRIINPLVGVECMAGQASLWPIAERVEIGVSGSRVLDHVTIIDLPGISDTNTIRCDLAVQYIKTCDHLWIVSPIKRIADDATVSNLLSRYAKVFNNRVKVICTSIDEGINRQLANHLDHIGVDIEQYLPTSEELKVKQRELNATNRKYTGLIKRKKQTPEVVQLSQRLHVEMLRLTTEISEIEHQLLESLVTKRNVHVTELLRANMQIYLPSDQTLSVACVSNLHYASLRGSSELAGACLSAESTGIPALRADCLKLEAPALMETFTNHLNNKVASFLEDVEMFTQTNVGTQRRALLNIVEQPQAALPSMIAEHRELFTKTADGTLGAMLIAEEDSIINTALQRLEQKLQKHPHTIRAFLRQNGSYSTKICPQEDWNEDFSCGMIDIVKQHGQKWKAECNAVFDGFRAAVIAGMQNMLNELRREASSISIPMKNFTALVDIKMSAAEALFINLQTEFENSLKSVYLDITQNSSENHFSRTMMPIYESCRGDSGNGVTQRCISKVRAHLMKNKDDSPFVEARNEAVKALKNCGHLHLTQQVHPQVSPIFTEIYAAFDRMINKSVETPGQKAARVKLTLNIEDLQEQLPHVQSDLADVVRRY